MTETEHQYFDWLVSFIVFDGVRRYKALLRHLFDALFYYSIPMDGNRATDGCNLRYRFADENHTEPSVIAVCIDYRDCSMLEMLVALSIRCENQFMDNGIENRTPKWFWGMLESMGLMDYDDDSYNPIRVDAILKNFYEKTYSPDGRGGLFTVPGRNDMRRMEIWYQLCAYLNSIIDKE